MSNVPDQFQVDSEVLVDNHVSEVIHATPRDFGVQAGEFIRYARRCFPRYFQRVKNCPLKDFVGFEFFDGHTIKVIRYKINGIEDPRSTT